ncbi:MAG: glycosyltransferase family 2 protein [Acidobacteriota bacterium]|nr:glycosyltransferase family 2 protein [Acidobacteriota bacterium]
MVLSVVIASYNSPHILRRCLESLSQQPEAREIVVSDCSTEDPASELAILFPRIKFLHFNHKMTIPELRWAGYRETSGDIVASTEGRCIPSSTWCTEVIQAHMADEDAPAIGGPIMINLPATAYDAGLFFCEYGMYCPPLFREFAAEISGANVCYKRSALEDCSDLMAAGSWETAVHKRFRSQGRVLRMSGAMVFFQNSMGFSTAMRQRFNYGRGYGAERVRGRGRLVRIAYGGATLALPILIIFRLARISVERSKMKLFMGSLPCIFVLTVIWSMGEMTGYLAGMSPQKKVY